MPAVITATTFRIALRATGAWMRSSWKAWLPFLIIAAGELACLGLIWLAPHPPFANVLAPPLRFFFGDRVLHYPLHLWFLYHAMKHAHLVTALVVGAFMTGIACAMVRHAQMGQTPSLRTALVTREVRYGTMVMLWLVMWALGKGIGLAVFRFAPHAPWTLAAASAAVILLQALFVYAIPAAVFERLSWWRALLQSAKETLRYPVTTLLVTVFSSSALILFAVFASPARVGPWLWRTTPELVFLFMAARLVLWTVADAFLTLIAAHLWWARRTPQELPRSSAAPAPVGRPARVLEEPLAA